MAMTLWYIEIIQHWTNITMEVPPLPMDGGALELVFNKSLKALENQFLNPILIPATSVFNKVNLSLIIWSYLQT